MLNFRRKSPGCTAAPGLFAVQDREAPVSGSRSPAGG